MLIKCYLGPICLFLAGNIIANSPAEQLSEYTDCSDSSFQETVFDSPLTQEEKTKKLDDAFYGLISEESKCTKSSFSQSSQSNAGGSGGSGGSNGADIGSLSNNLLDAVGESIAIGDSMNQLPDVEVLSEASSGEPSDGQNGREHLALEDVDNRKALRLQIKKQAELESDPEVKRKLLEQYEALK